MAWVDDATPSLDQQKFDEVDTIADGLGPLYNAQSCRECQSLAVRRLYQAEHW
jgi:hypothetical protein